MSNDVLGSMSVVIGANTQAFEGGLEKATRKAGSFSAAMGKIKNVNLAGQVRPLQQQAGLFEKLENRAMLYQRALRKATDEATIGRLNTKLAQTNAEMARLRSISNGVSGSMNRLGGSANGVGMEFARIIQDAPYGMMGIGNNIQQLTANFGQLQQQTGSFSGALKASFASILSMGSLLTLGIAAITSGFVLYQKYQQSAAKATKDGTGAMYAAKKAGDDYKQTLNALSNAHLTGAQEAQKEMVTLRLLYKQTQATTLSMEDRLKAVKEIQKQYPSYFEGFTKEEILAGKAKTAYDKLSQSILATAKARAAQDIIADNARKQLENEQKLIDLKRELAQQQEKVNKSASIDGLGNAALASESGAIRRAMNVSKAQGQVKDTQDAINKITKENNKLKADSIRLEKEYFNQVLQGAEVTSEDKSKGDKERLSILQQLAKDLKAAEAQALLFGASFDLPGEKAQLIESAIKALTDEGLSPQGKVLTGLAKQWEYYKNAAQLPQLESQTSELKFKTVEPNIDWTKRYFDVHSKMVEANRLAIQSNLAFGDSFSLAAANVSTLETGIASLLENGFGAMSPQVQALVKELEKAKLALQWEDAVSGLEANVEKLAEGVFVSLGEQLGNVFAGLSSGDDALEMWGQTIISSLGAVMSQFGQELIALGIGKMALDTMFSMPGGGALAIAAGTALVAAGSALSASMQKSTGSLGGGGSLGPSMSGSGGYRPSGDMGRGPIEITGTIKGSDLQLALDRTNYKNRRVRG